MSVLAAGEAHGQGDVACRDTSLARRLSARLSTASGASSYWRGMNAVLSACSADTDDPHVTLGRLISIPFAAFSVHVLEESRRLGVDRLFFLAREGAFFLRACRRLARARGEPMPKSAYLGVSRASTFLPSMHDLNLDEIGRLWRQYPRQSMARLLRNLSLEATGFGEHARRCGVADLDAPIENPWTHAGLARFLDDRCVREDFAVARDAARTLLAEYLRARGWFDARLAGVVDIGWKGTMQTNLWRAAPITRLHGMYMAHTHVAGEEAAESTRAGYLADTRADDWAQDQVLLNGPVFEMFATARHGSVRGYARRNGQVRPIIEPHEQESDNFAGVFARVHRGLDEGLSAIVDAGAWRGVSADDLRHAALDLMRRYVVYPTRREAEAFKAYSHVENFGVYETARYEFTDSIGRLIASGPVASAPRRIKDAILRHLWPPGVVRRSGFPFANAMLDLALTRRARR